MSLWKFIPNEGYKLRSKASWGYLKDVQMWYLGIWFSGGLGSVRLMVGLNDLKGPFQSKWFYNSKM